MKKAEFDIKHDKKIKEKEKQGICVAGELYSDGSCVLCDCVECDILWFANDICDNKALGVTALKALMDKGFAQKEALEQIWNLYDIGTHTELELCCNGNNNWKDEKNKKELISFVLENNS